MEIKNTMIDVLYCFLNAISNIKTTKIIFNEIQISDGLIRKITGTLVHGKIANSVTTAVTKSAGVTSYMIFKRFSDFFVFQFVNNDFSTPFL